MEVHLNPEARAQLRELVLVNRPLRDCALNIVSGNSGHTHMRAEVVASALDQYGCPQLADAVRNSPQPPAVLAAANQFAAKLFGAG